MFKEKYKSDNNLIVPDKALLSSLAEKMKSYQETDISTSKSSKKINIYFNPARILASCICVFIISASALYFISGNKIHNKSAEDIIEKNSTITTESAPASPPDINMSERKENKNLLGGGNQCESEKEDFKKDIASDILTSGEIDNIEISIFTKSKNNLLTISNTSDIRKITDFFNKLYNAIDKSILIDIDINESKGEKIETTFYMKDGTKKIAVIYDNSYFKMDSTEWFPVQKNDITWYNDFISEHNTITNQK